MDGYGFLCPICREHKHFDSRCSGGASMSIVVLEIDEMTPDALMRHVASAIEAAEQATAISN